MLRFLSSSMPLWCALLALVLLAYPEAPRADLRLNEATVIVDNRDRPARQEGFVRALDQVLVKLSGDRQMLRDPRVDDLRQQAGRYVQRFRYVETADGGIGLEVLFDGDSLGHLLAERGLPVWGGNRPTVMVWLAALHQGERVILGGGEARELMQTLERVASERGIELVFPVMDLEDRLAVNYADLTGGFMEPVLRASERYSARHVVAASLQPRGSAWTSRWRVQGQELRDDFQMDRDSVDDVLEEALHELVDRLGRRFAIAGLLPTADHVRVVVEGVDNLAEYQRVRQHLSDQSVVVNVRLYRLEPDRAVFLTQLRGSARDLERGVQLGRVLEPTEPVGERDPDAMPQVHLRVYR